jgi:holin-like protein
MTSNKWVVVGVRRLVHRSAVLQVGLLLLFWLAGEGLVQWTDLPLPGGVVGMALVLAFLAGRRLRPGTVRRGAQWLLGEMLLFFVPAVLAVLNHRELLGVVGLKLLAAILLGTAAVMVATALTVELCLRSAGHGRPKPLA